MVKVLMLYSTTDGHTVKICERIQSILESTDHQVTLLPVVQADTVELPAFDKIIVGASIRYGKHQPAVSAFIENYAPLLKRKPTVFFSVNVVARKPNKNRPDTNPYLKKFLARLNARTDWTPDLSAAIAGKIDYPRYGILDRTIIRCIMWMTKGPTDPRAVVEFTDWAAVTAFANQIAQLDVKPEGSP